MFNISKCAAKRRRKTPKYLWSFFWVPKVLPEMQNTIPIATDTHRHTAYNILIAK